MHYYIISYPKKQPFVHTGEFYIAKFDFDVKVRDSDGILLTFHFKAGFTTDGGSVPACFQWFVPGWDENNILLCIAYALHDACYGAELVSKDLADDMLRGLLRDAGLNRLRASTVCWCVNNFARRHYGEENDRWNCKKYCSLSVDCK